MNVDLNDGSCTIPAEAVCLNVFGVLHTSFAHLSSWTGQVVIVVLFLTDVSIDGESNSVNARSEI